MSTPSNGFQIPTISAATEAMIRRIREGAGAGAVLQLDASAVEAARRSVLQGMKTTVTMEISTPPSTKEPKRSVSAKGKVARTPSTSSKGKGSAKGKKAGMKRKRVKEESESTEEDEEDDMSGLGGDSDSDEVTSVGKQTKSGRKVSKPNSFTPALAEATSRKRGPSKRSLEQTLCKRCGRGHSPANNMIVFCDGCNAGWHQMCHDPMVSDETVKDEASEWFCTECEIRLGRVPGFDASKYTSARGKTMEEVCSSSLATDQD
jgi:hypothetical protein